MIKKLIELKNQLWAWAKRRPALAAVAGVAVVLILFSLGRSVAKKEVQQNLFHTVKRGDFLVSIVEGGTLKAVNEVTVRSELEGQSRIISIVPEGTTVKEGDTLVELDASDIKERLTQQEVVFQSSQFNYIQAKEALAIQKSVVESNIKENELRVEFAESDLEKYKEGEWPQAKRQIESDIALSKEELTRAKDRLEWTVKLQEKGYATKAELEGDQFSVQKFTYNLQSLEEKLRISDKYDYPKRTRLLESNVEQAKKDLERLKLRSASQIAQFEADLKTRQNTLDLHEQRLQLLKEQLNFTKITAPQEGLVIYASSGNPNSGILIEEGATIRQRQDIIKLPDVSQMMLEVRVHESHVQQIKPGLPAFVTIDSVPDKQFKGIVRRVAVLPDSSSRYYNPNLKVYTTEVLVEDKLPDLKPGVSGRAEIIVTNLHNVLSVPIQAVTTVKGKQVCLVETNGGVIHVPVEIGLYNDRLIEIKSGLREKDRVKLAPQDEADNMDLGGSIATTEEAAEAQAQADAKKASGVSVVPEVKKVQQKKPPAIPKMPGDGASSGSSKRGDGSRGNSGKGGSGGDGSRPSRSSKP
jgi:HlyD family secretion protein